ncbi:glycerophosphocholine phosphodiesterase GPCPD1, partial [Drosophila busckii]
MQRWLNTDNDDDAMAAPLTCPASPTVERIYGDINASRLWKFRVLVTEQLASNERLALVGNCDALGNWQSSGAAIMSLEPDSEAEDSQVWQAQVYIPRQCGTEYRYFVCAVDPITEQLVVRRWEVQLQPRCIAELQQQAAQVQDTFGSYNGLEKVDRGWLTKETLVQLKFFYAPFSWKQRMKRRLVHVKVTPMNLRIPSADAGTCSSTLEDSLSNDTHDTRENGGDNSAAFGFSEVVTLSAEECELRAQEQFGAACGASDLVIFHLTVLDLENTAYLVDLYSYSSRVAKEDGPPQHLGYHYVLPNLLKRSEGNLELPITCAKSHRPLGMMRLGYLLVKPSSVCANMEMQVSYARYWNNKWTGLDVGHRGSGTSFKAKDAVIRENTITS